MTALAPTQTGIFTALVSVLNGFGLVSSTPGQAVPVFRGQVNRVPEPAQTDYVMLWPLFRNRLATNTESYDLAAGTLAETQETDVTIQADVHGPTAADNASRISTLFRSQIGVAAFQAAGNIACPLYTSDPRQMPFENGEQQTEERWSIDLTMQANVSVTVPQDFAETLTATASPVEALYPVA